MAVLKKIKFGTGAATPIAQTIVTAASESVLSVVGTNTDIDDNADPSYAVDLNISADGTLVKDTTGQQAVLKVGTVPAAQVSVADSANKFTATDVEGALAELKGDIAEVVADGKSYSIVDDTANVQDLPTNVLKRYRLQQTIGSQTPTLVGEPIDILKDNSLLAAKLSTTDATWNGSAIVDGEGKDALVLVYMDANGTAQVIPIDVSAFLTETEFKDGLAVGANGEVSAKLGQGLEFGGESGENQSIKVKIDSASEKDGENADFLTVGAGGVKIQGIKAEIDRKITALDVTTDAAVSGQYVAAIQETDGIVGVKTRANVSEAVLNNYAKGSDGAAVAATDTINQAISKLENQVDAAKQAATAGHSVVAKDTDASHLTLSESTDSTTGQKTYTIGEDNIASASDLTAEVTRAKNAEGEIADKVGLTGAEGSRTFTPTTNYGTGSTTIMDNMRALDTQLKTVSDNLNAITYEVNGTELIFRGIEPYVAPSPEPEPEP